MSYSKSCVLQQVVTKQPCSLTIKLVGEYSSFGHANILDITSNWKIYREFLLFSLLCCLQVDWKHAKCWERWGPLAGAHPWSQALMFISVFSCLEFVQTINWVSMEFLGCLWKDGMYSCHGSVTTGIALAAWSQPQAGEGLGWGKEAHGHTCSQCKPQEKTRKEILKKPQNQNQTNTTHKNPPTNHKPNKQRNSKLKSQTNSDYKDRNWVIKLQRQLRWLWQHILTFLVSQREESFCLPVTCDWQRLRPCSQCLGQDELAGKLEVLSETIIQFLSSVQLMAFI